MSWEKPVKIGEKERYTFSLKSWLNGEALISCVVTPQEGVTLSAVDIAGDPVCGFFATGVTKGVYKLRFDYATATRTDYVIIPLQVIV